MSPPPPRLPFAARGWEKKLLVGSLAISGFVEFLGVPRGERWAPNVGDPGGQHALEQGLDAAGVLNRNAYPLARESLPRQA